MGAGTGFWMYGDKHLSPGTHSFLAGCEIQELALIIVVRRRKFQTLSPGIPSHPKAGFSFQF